MDLGWGDIVRSKEMLRVVSAPGSHLTMLRKPHASYLATLLSDLLSSPTNMSVSAATSSPIPSTIRPTIPTSLPPAGFSTAIIASAGVMAPSGHNTQPWRFSVADDRIHLFIDTEYGEVNLLCLTSVYPSLLFPFPFLN